MSCVRLSNFEDPLEPQLLKIAMRYVGEWQLVVEGEHLNRVRGVAVTTRLLVERARLNRDTLPHWVEHRAQAPFGRPGAAERNWAHRFRNRWGARIGKVRSTAIQSIDDMQAKVSALRFFFLHSLFF